MDTNTASQSSAPCITRTAEESRLRDLGVSGPAMETLLRAGGPARHMARVAATRAAAVAAFGEHAAVALALDLMGVGGPQGLGGDSTDRMEPFRGLGKGRWHATDGRAYRSALEGVLVREPYPHSVTVTPSGASSVLYASPDATARWVVAAGTRALGEFAGVVPPRPDLAGKVAFATPEVDGDRGRANAREWSSIVEAAQKRIDEKTRARLFASAWASVGYPYPPGVDAGTDPRLWVPESALERDSAGVGFEGRPYDPSGGWACVAQLVGAVSRITETWPDRARGCVLRYLVDGAWLDTLPEAESDASGDGAAR